MAGITCNSARSLSGVDKPPVNLIASPSTNTFTWTRTSPVSFVIRSRSPGCIVNNAASAPRTSAGDASRLTSLAPPAHGRNGPVR